MSEVIPTAESTSASEITPGPESSLEASASPQPEPSPESAPPSAMDPANPQAPIAPQWQPSFKYKAWGKEYDIDEAYRKLIKDKESEEMISKLLSRGHGLEEFQTRHQSLKSELDELRPQIEQYNQVVDELNHYAKTGDWQSFFERLNVPDDAVIKTALHKLKMQDLPEDQRKAYNQHRESSRKAFEYERQNHAMAERLKALEVQTRTSEVRSAMSSPDVAPIVQAFDQIYGQGAFLEEVKRAGKAHYFETGEDLSGDAVVEAMAQKYSPLLSKHITNPANPGSQSLTKPKEVPVIPASGGNASQAPVQRVPRSIADLRKMRENREF